MKLFIFVSFIVASSLAAAIPEKIIEPIITPIIPKNIDHLQTKRDILTLETPTVFEKEIVDEPIITEKIIGMNFPTLNKEFIVERYPLIENLKMEKPVFLERDFIKYEEPLRNERIKLFPRRFYPYFDETMRSLYEKEFFPMGMRYQRPMNYMSKFNRGMYDMELDFIKYPLGLDTLEPNMYSDLYPLKSLTKPVIDFL